MPADWLAIPSGADMAVVMPAETSTCHPNVSMAHH